MDTNPLDALIAEAERLIRQRDENWAVVESISDLNDATRRAHLEFYLNCIRGLGDLAPRLLAVVKAARDGLPALPPGRKGSFNDGWQQGRDEVLDAMTAAAEVQK